MSIQYLISVIHDQAGLGTPDEHAAIDVFNERLQAEGNWIFARPYAGLGQARRTANFTGSGTDAGPGSSCSGAKRSLRSLQT